MHIKIRVVFIISVLLLALIAGWLALTASRVQEPASQTDTAQTGTEALPEASIGLGGELSEQIEGPAQELPQTNPFQANTNPLENAKTNPFEELYTNPFDR